MPPAPRKHRRHWTIRAATWLLLILIVIVGALWFTGEQIAQSILRQKLQTLISQQLNARLEMGKLSYHFPYGMSVADVSLVTRAQDGSDLKLMSFDLLKLTVAKFPLGHEPLVIEQIDIDHPIVHVIRTANGIIGETSFLRDEIEKKKDLTHPPKLSEVLRLRHLAFTKGRVEYDDRTVPGNRPLIWENLTANMDAQPLGDVSHRFAFTANNGDIGKIESAGAIDLDSLVLTLDKLNISTAVRRKQTNSALPAQQQQILATLGISGSASVNLHGTFPLRNLKDADAGVDLRIDDGHSIVPALAESVQDLTFVAGGEYKHGDVHGKIERFEFRTASIGMSLQPLSGTFDRSSGRWLLDPIKAAIVYEPIDSTNKFWRQKITVIVRCALHQQDDRNHIEAVLDGTKITPQGLAGDINIDGTLAIDKESVNVRPTTITGLGGTISVSAMINYLTHASAARVVAQDVDLAKVNVVLDPVTSKEMKGQLSGQVQMLILGDVQNVTGEGGFRVTDGKFARIPVLSQIADFLHIGRGAFEANDAFGHFKIADQTLNFDRMAVSTSLLRIRGQGKIGFDQKLDLKVYADSASNWKKDVKKTGIPIFSDLIGAVAGGTQSVIGGVSKQITTMSVTGTINEPKIVPAPVPLFTDNLDKLFKAVE